MNKKCLMGKLLLASDYDGTIRKEQVDQNDLNSINHFRNQGNIFGIVTGRAINMIWNELGHFNVTYDFLIGNNGGIIVDKNQNVLFQNNIDADAAKRLISELAEIGMFVYGFSDGIRYARKSQETDRKPQRLISNVISNYSDVYDANVFNSIFFRSRNQDETLRWFEQMKQKYGRWMDFHFNAGTVDVSAKNINKASGVHQIREFYQCSHVFTFGDNYNDIEMIRQFNGFAISSGVEELKERASQVFDGISEVIAFIESQE